jgi:hypothetical protein
MQKEFYEKPNITWLKEKFKGVKLGWLKASEMEVYLAYMLMYDNDLGKTAYDIAEEYGYTESKVSRLLVEFAKRFRANESEKEFEFLNRIFNAMICKDESVRIVPICSDKMISFTLYDPADARTLRKIINKSGMMSISDTSRSVFHLTPIVFATLFADCNEEFKDRLRDKLNESGKVKKEFNQLFPSKMKKILSTIAHISAYVTEHVMSNAISAAFNCFCK